MMHRIKGAAALQLLLVLFFSIFAPLIMPADSLEELAGSSYFTAEQQRLLEREFEEAEEAGVPEAFLLPRLEEALAKKVHFPRIITVLRRERDAFSTALELMKENGFGDDPAEADWQRSAHLLLSGLGKEDTGRLLAAFAGRQEAYRPGTSLYLALSSWGMRWEEALILTEAAAQSPLEARQFSGIPDILTAAQRMRIRSEEIVERIAEELPYSETVEELRNRVLY